MAFEFDNLFHEDPVTVEFLPNDKIKKGHGLKLQLNRDIISLDFLDRAKKWVEDFLPAAPANTQAEGAPVAVDDSLKSNLEVMDGMADAIRQFAKILGGKPGENVVGDRVIVSWDLVRGGEPVPVAYEELVKWKFSLLQNLFTFCVFEAQQVEKKPGKRSAKP